MELIKIISGLYGYKAPGSKFIDPKNVNSPPFKVEDGEAERLINLGVAAYCLDVDEMEDEAMTGRSGSENSTEEDGKPAYSVDMKADELKKLMEKYGLSLKARMSKDDMVAALDEFFDNEDDGTEPDDDSDEVEDGEELPPSPSAEEPVI